MNRVQSLATGLLFAAALMAGCSKEEPPKPAPKAEAPPAETVVKIGVAAPLTGPQAHIGVDIKNGVQLAVDDANAQGLTIDGKKIKDTFQASHGASFGQGFNLNLEVTKRPVPARPMQVKIRGSHITGAPIQEIASRAAGTFFSVEGVVAFDPKPDMRYIVKGILQKNGSSVWIEEESSGQVVTDKVVEN